MRLPIRAAVSTTAALALFATGAADAGTFDIKTPEVTKGEAEIGTNSTYFAGFPDNAERLRQSYEVSLGYGLTDWWKLGLKVNLDKPVDEGFRASTLGYEQTTVLRKLNGGFGLGWYSGVDLSLVAGNPDVSTFGPILQFGTDKTSLTLNPFLAKTFGADKVAGIALNYGWQVKHELRQGFAVGIEGYGVVPDLGHSPGLDFQEHRIGPVVYLEREIRRSALPGGTAAGTSVKDAAGNGAAAAKFNFEAGVLFGLTQGTQDVAVKIKGGVTF